MANKEQNNDTVSSKLRLKQNKTKQSKYARSKTRLHCCCTAFFSLRACLQISLQVGKRLPLFLRVIARQAIRSCPFSVGKSSLPPHAKVARSSPIRPSCCACLSPRG